MQSRFIFKGDAMASAAQIAARKKFSDIMKAGGFAKKRAAKKTVAKKAVAKKRVTKKNPIILISDTPKKRTVIRRVNPVAKSVTKKSYSNFPYVVEVKREGFKSAYGNIPAQFEMHAGFQTKAEASDLAKMIAAQYPNVTVRVKSYK
jgi:ribosomal protein S8E